MKRRNSPPHGKDKNDLYHNSKPDQSSVENAVVPDDSWLRDPSNEIT